jgi:hypothetical protein
VFAQLFSEVIPVTVVLVYEGFTEPIFGKPEKLILLEK